MKFGNKQGIRNLIIFTIVRKKIHVPFTDRVILRSAVWDFRHIDFKPNFAGRPAIQIRAPVTCEIAPGRWTNYWRIIEFRDRFAIKFLLDRLGIIISKKKSS